MVARLPSPALVPLAANAARPGEGGIDPMAIPPGITTGVPSIDPDNDDDNDMPVPYNETAPAAVADIPVSNQKGRTRTGVPTASGTWQSTPSAGNP